MRRIRSALISIGKKHRLFMSFSRFFNSVIKKLRYLYFYLFNKVDDKLIVFEVFNGRKYCDSPKAIYEYLLNDKKFKDYKFVWSFNNPDKYKYLLKNQNTLIVKSKSKQYLKMFSKAKYWIVNYRLSNEFLKKKNQIYIQCWHGTPLKRLGCDIEIEGNLLNTKREIHKEYINDSKRYNYMISSSSFSTARFLSAFGIKDKSIIIEEGYPRNDFIVNHTIDDEKRVKRELKIPENKKVILYAPTFRDNQHKSDLGYTYKTEIDFDYLHELLSKDYIILFRAHYLVANSFDFDKYKGFIYDVSEYDDINDLYIISDLLITDYSSVFFDYSILKRPIIFYMYDLEEYKNNLRDFYIDLKELPGNIVRNEKDLINEIVNNKNVVYNSKYKKFNERFTYLDDGNSSRRVVEKCMR